MEERKVSSLEGWRSDALKLSLESSDVELLDAVLCVVPELRIVTFLAQEARKRRLSYPVSSAQELVDCLAGDSFELAGHAINAETVLNTLPEQWFPIAHEGELLSVIHLALRRCQAEVTQRAMQHVLTAFQHGTRETQR